MNILDRVFNRSRVKALESQIMALQQFNTVNEIYSNLPIYPKWELEHQVRRYTSTDDIYSIIRLISQTCALIPIYAYEVKDEKSYKQLSGRFDVKSLVRDKMIQAKALEELTEADRLYKLLESPHQTLSKYEFLEAIYTLLPLQGEVIIYKMRAEYGVNKGLPISLEILESHNIIRRISGFPHRITSYDYRENGVEIITGIPPEDIIHIKYFKTLSPLQALHRRLTRLDSGIEVSTAQLQNGGVPGIVYDKNDDAEITIGTQRKTKFYEYLTNKSNKGAPYFSNGELGYIELGLKSADMDVLQLGEIDFKKLCNAFMVSDRLFNNDATGSEVSDDNAQKSLYTRACLPSIYRVRDAFINSLVPDFAVDKKKRTIREDISEIPALQADMLKMAQAVSALPYFIPNAVQELFHFQKYDDAAADEMYVKTGYVKLSDLQGTADLPPTPDYVN